MNRFKNTLGDDITNLIGPQGVRTDVSIALDPITIAILALLIPLTVAAGILIAGAIKK
jgi:hypothetical protein